MDKMTPAAIRAAIADDHLLHRTYVEQDQRILDAVVPRWVDYEEDEDHAQRNGHNVPEQPRQQGRR